MEASVAAPQKGLCLQALAVALQHPAVASRQRNICTLLQVSQAWRNAVLRSAACLTDICFNKDVTLDNLNSISALARWLAKHPGLVRSLGIQPQYTGAADCSAVAEVVQYLLAFSLQAAATVTTSDPALIGHGATQLRLQSYTSSVPPTAGLLAALPAATLTNLQLDTVDSSNWYSRISQLSNLQYLSLNMSPIFEQSERSITNGCLGAIGRLQQLTQLKLRNVAAVSDMRLLPAQLERLVLKYRQLEGNNSCAIQLQHLTALRQLQLEVKPLAAMCSLPTNLRYLEIDAEWTALEVADLGRLQQVTSVRLKGAGIRSLHLAPLLRLKELRVLSLGLFALEIQPDMMDVAAAWHKLPLCSLQLSVVDQLDRTVVQQLMQHVATATKLTELEVRISGWLPHEDDVPLLSVCQQLVALKNLQKLTLCVGQPADFVEQDAEHLSQLVTLTSLELGSDGSGPYMDTTILCLLAVTLTELKHLSINYSADGPFTPTHQVGCLHALPAIGRLTGLESLHLETLSVADARRGWKLLTGLTRLTSLRGFSRAGAEALRAFRESWRAQRQRCRS